MDVRWHEGERDGTRLCCADYGGDGTPVVLLHGLAGHAREWDSTAEWLTHTHRVVAIEARGHGRSERVPADRSPAAFVADAAFWIERLALAPAVVAGQSLGGLTALLLAARRPALVRAVVVAEATPAEDPSAVAIVRRWLASWPVPFPAASDALEFFGGDTLWARSWTAGLEARPGGLWPAFDGDVLLDALAQASAGAHWDEWARVTAPALVVRAEDGVPPDQALRMIDALPGSRLAEIAGAGHDLHLDQPLRWRAVLSDFLDGLAR